VEASVPVFTQHTQFFHKHKIPVSKYFPSRKCNESWKKIAKPAAVGETFPKHLPGFSPLPAVEKAAANRKIFA